MVARREGKRDMSLLEGDFVARTRAADDDVARPSIEPIDGIGISAYLPATGDQDSARDQKPGDHDGNGYTQGYCPWCSGPLHLSEKGREAANLLRERTRDTESRWRAGDLSVRGLGKSGHRQEEATRSGQAGPHQEAPKSRRQKGNRPNFG